MISFSRKSYVRSISTRVGLKYVEFETPVQSDVYTVQVKMKWSGLSLALKSASRETMRRWKRQPRLSSVSQIEIIRPAKEQHDIGLKKEE